MDVEIIGRVAERLIVVLLGGVSLAFGWHLFRIGVVNEQIAELKKADLTIRLQKVGPGVFFSLVGGLVLVTAIINPATRETTDQGVTTSYLNVSDDQLLKKWVEALNTPLRNISESAVAANDVTQIELEEVVKANPYLAEIRNKLISRRFGADALRDWSEFGDRFVLNENNVPSSKRDNLAKLKPWMIDTLR